MRRASGIIIISILTAALCAAVAHPASAADVDRQRSLFIEVFDDVERGDWEAVSALSAADRQLLEQYVLWPDLRATYLRARIRTADRDEIEAFLDHYGMLKPARELRYRHSLELARRGDLEAFHAIYQSFYQGLGIASLDCLALQAELQAGRDARVIHRARDLWLVGESQVDECDPVFEFLKSGNHLSAIDYRERFELAVEAREFSLARWIAKSIDEQHIQEARTWRSAQSNPERFLRSYADRRNSLTSQQQLAYAAERLTFRDPQLARELWAQIHQRYSIAEELHLKTSRHIALWTARDNLPGAYELLTALPVAAQDDEVLRWRARTSLRRQQWLNLLDDYAAMSDAEKSAEEWRYWRAVALGMSGQVLAARGEFELLAGERSFYGFLAADEVDQAYAFEHSELGVDEQRIAELAKRPDLMRARELYRVGQDGRGRSEWDAVVAYFDAGDKAHAAVLADRWQWHSRAIAAAASVGEYDDLSLRYPLPFQATFEQYASAARIPSTWAYGIARSESLFMRDIRSSAGAIGLMQLMPATGRSVAREIDLPYSGLDTLTDPQSNIRLGTTYLAMMVERFDGNRVLATAAYNAGPHRVDRWMPEEGSMDARIWIENIPFNETRNYVRRVMAAETIFHWRINGTTRRLSDELGNVEAPSGQQRLAAR